MEFINKNLSGKYLYSHYNTLTPSVEGDIYYVVGDPFFCRTSNQFEVKGCNCIYNEVYEKYDYYKVSATVKNYGEMWKLSDCEYCCTHNCSSVDCFSNYFIVATNRSSTLPAIIKLDIDHSKFINSFFDNINMLESKLGCNKSYLFSEKPAFFTLSDRSPIINPREISAEYMLIGDDINSAFYNAGAAYSKYKLVGRQFIFDDVKYVPENMAKSVFRDKYTLIKNDNLAANLGFSIKNNYILVFYNFYEISPLTYYFYQLNTNKKKPVITFMGITVFHRNIQEFMYNISTCEYDKYKSYFPPDSYKAFRQLNDSKCNADNIDKNSGSGDQLKGLSDKNKNDSNDSLVFYADTETETYIVQDDNNTSDVYTDNNQYDASGHSPDKRILGVFDYSDGTYSPKVEYTALTLDEEENEFKEEAFVWMPSTSPSDSGFIEERVVDEYAVYHNGDKFGGRGDLFSTENHSDYHHSTTYTRHYRRKRKRKRKIKVIPPSVSCKLNVIAMYSPNIAVFSLDVNVKDGTATNFNPHLVALIDFGDGLKQKIYPHRYRTTYVAHTYNNSNEYKVNVYLHTGYSNIKSQCSTSVNFKGKVLPKGITVLSGFGLSTSKKSSFIKSDSFELILNDPMEVGLTDKFRMVFLARNPFITLSREKNG